MEQGEKAVVKTYENAMRKAQLSDETRELLIIKAKLADTIQSLYNWVDNYYSDPSKLLEERDVYKGQKTIDTAINLYIADSIEANMEVENFDKI